MDESANTEVMKQATEQWFKRNQDALKCPDNKIALEARSFQVLHMYMDRYLKDLDEIDGQMNWEYFQSDYDTDTEGKEQDSA